jgi:hypothetical protein
MAAAPNGEPFSTRSVGGGCGPPDVYLDGTLVRTQHNPRAFEEVVPAATNIMAVEAYFGLGTIPLQFVSANSRCGVLVVWTER